MHADEIKNRLLDVLPRSEVMIEGDDGVHFNAIIVSPEFENLSLLKRQQKVYAALNEWIASGALHALSMRTLTPDEWARERSS